jgi:hypothetical protein
MKFRIVEIVNNVSSLGRENSDATYECIIQKKNLFGLWREIKLNEISSTRISHKTYDDAEAYMFANYMGHGVCEKIGNVYTYTAYTYTYFV